MDTYTIKPLEWKKTYLPDMQTYTADVPGGSYNVRRVREDFDESKPWETWRWEYCFCEYYDEGTHECRTAAEGRQQAWEHWIKRLLPALQPPGGPQP